MCQALSCLADTVLVAEFVHGGECDQGVDILDTEGGGLAEDDFKGEMSGQERTDDECEAEVEQPTDQSQTPVRTRKPSNCHGEWILKGLQQMSHRLKMLVDKARNYKELIKTLKPKLLKEARTLEKTVHSFSDINFQEFLLTD